MDRRQFLKALVTGGVAVAINKPELTKELNDIEKLLGERVLSICQGSVATQAIFALAGDGTVFRSDDFLRYDIPNWTVVTKCPDKKWVYTGSVRLTPIALGCPTKMMVKYEKPKEVMDYRKGKIWKEGEVCLEVEYDCGTKMRYKNGWKVAK